MSRPARARVIRLADRRPNAAVTTRALDPKERKALSEGQATAVAIALRLLDDQGPPAVARFLARVPDQGRVLAELGAVSTRFAAAWTTTIRDLMGYPANRRRGR